MELKELYEVYGKLMVQEEILIGQKNQIKQQLQEALNKPPVAKVKVKEPKADVKK